MCLIEKAKKDIMRRQLEYCLIKYGCNNLKECLSDIEAIIDGEDLIPIPKEETGILLVDFDLSKRLENCFNREDIFTIEQLKTYIIQDISFLKNGRTLTIRNFGEGLKEEMYEKIPGIKQYCDEVRNKLK